MVVAADPENRTMRNAFVLLILQPTRVLTLINLKKNLMCLFRNYTQLVLYYCLLVIHNSTKVSNTLLEYIFIF